MNARWVAVTVRSRGLLERRLGEEGARRVAAAESLDMAIAELLPTHYGEALRKGMDLALAQHAVSATVLFDLRVLAGWSPPLGAGSMRAVAGHFEIENVLAQLGAFAGVDIPAPYELGSLATVPRELLSSRSVTELRRWLAASAWGDPETDDTDGIQFALELRWARRLVDEVEAAGSWARARAAITVGRLLEAGELGALSPAARRDAGRVLGPTWDRAHSLAELLERSRVSLPGVAHLETGAPGPWQAELATWALLGQGAIDRLPLPDENAPVHAAELLLLDAWRTRAALALAERGGGDLGSELDVGA